MINADGKTTYSNVNNLPKLRILSQDEVPLSYEANPPSIYYDNDKLKSKRRFYFFNKSLEAPDITEDLSTRHTESFNDNGYLSQITNSFMPRHFQLTDNMKFILNCCMWYVSSSLTNNMGKSIMIVFQFPVTLTFIQFVLVAVWCYLASVLFGSTHIRSPTKIIVQTISPLALFLIVGHVFSSIAISKIPVSLVHTIKALAPLFTVLFYRCIFQVKYSNRVYISLLPLTMGVIFACSFTYSNNFIGLSFALASCFVFVTQNIYSKKLLFKESKLGERNPNKLDKLNMLFYSSAISSLLMIPLWIYVDGYSLIQYGQQQEEKAISTSQLLFYLFINGTTNFSQNWFAFTTLSLTSPITYSIFSLLKRIFVIVMSIIWFGQSVSGIQSFGILLTFVGLWMYQQAKADVDKNESKLIEKSINLLPIQQNKTETWTPKKL